MTLSEMAVTQLNAVRTQFDNSAGVLDECVATFRPGGETMTVAQHVAHAAQVIDWLVDGAFAHTGFDLDFEAQIARVMAVQSLTAARNWFERALSQAILAFEGRTDAEMMTLLPAGPVMGGLPRLLVITAIAEHTSHHRGALSVYARLQGIVPQSPYGI